MEYVYTKVGESDVNKESGRIYKMNIQELRETFNEVYGEGGDIREYFAPGRVNLI